MAHLSASTAHNVTAIRIVKVKGASTNWYQIYLDDLALCAVFGAIEDELPTIVTYGDDEKVTG